MTEAFLSQKELARRWGLSPRTLERWRWIGSGPRFLKLGSRVSYRLSDIERFETARLCERASADVMPDKLNPWHPEDRR
jgi:hypothetical protein